jgi:DNA-binding CsgD family transcriptional regulator
MLSTHALAPANPAFVADGDFSHVVGKIYDAALNPALATEVMDACRDFVGGLSATVFAKNVSGTQFEVYCYDGRLGASAVDEYMTSYAPIDPSNTIQVFADLDTAIITSRAVDLDTFLNSRFAREWAQPQELADMVVAPIVRRGGWSALFGVFRHERDGLGDDDARERVSMLAPHIRRAFTISDLMGRSKGEAASFREVIDGLATGVLLVDAEGRLVHANAAGTKLLGATRVFHAGREGTLRLEGTNLRELLPEAGSAAHGSFAIETADGGRYVAHILPLTGGARQFTGLGGDPVAALFIQPANFDPPSIPESLARAFDLTPSELRVVLATVRHDGAGDIAEALGIGESTVRTHLHRIFAKTETKRQADLVKLAAGFASPLAVR